MKKPMVISVAAVSGGGKTTIVKEVLRRMDHAEGLFFDDYDFAEAPRDIVQWAKNGPNYNLWNVDPMISDLQSNTEVSFIILDYPFSYRHRKMEAWIDYSIYIDTPLDIAMARRVLRDQSDGSKEVMNHYLTGGREAYKVMIDTIKPDADLVLDGTKSVGHLAEEIIEQIHKNTNE